MNDTLLVVGYGSLMSGFGLLAQSRLGTSPQLVALDAAPVTLRNARRGLAKWSRFGRYFAMDIEPLDRSLPISVSPEAQVLGIGGLVLDFDRKSAPEIARRDGYCADALQRLIQLADSDGLSLGTFLLAIAKHSQFDLGEYRAALFELLDYTSAHYIFHPVPIDDGRTAIMAIGSGFEGSGDATVKSRRQESGMDRLLGLNEALAQTRVNLEPTGQVGYYVECLLGGLHGIAVSDLLDRLDPATPAMRKLAAQLAAAAPLEVTRFLAATSMDGPRYRARFTGIAEPALAALIDSAGGAT
ncbi:MAG: hypothetical protein ACREQB_11650 [Candidatus Binataceae bacterium]